MTEKHYEWSRGGEPPTLLRHSEVKHSLLRDYLVDYFLTLVAAPQQERIQLTIVDGFCGGGRYINEAGEVVPGSPLIILRALEEARARLDFEKQRRKPIEFDVELICIDESPNAIEQLRSVLEEEGFGEKLRTNAVQLHQGDFATLVDSVVAHAAKRSPRAGRAILVLDQYGYDAVPLQSMQRIFATLNRAEIILTFSVDALITFLCEKNIADFERKTGIVGAVPASELDRLKRGPGWRFEVQSRLYYRLTTGCGAKFFTPFFIRPERGHGDYWLLHLSQHWKARDVMAKAHWDHHNHFVHYGAPGFDMLSTGYAARIDDQYRPQAAFEFDDAASAASQNAMLIQIPRALASVPDGIPFGRFFLDRVNDTPATKAMVERAVLQLVRDREVEVVGPDCAPRHVRRAVKPEHILRLPRQSRLVFC